MIIPSLGMTLLLSKLFILQPLAGMATGTIFKKILSKKEVDTPVKEESKPINIPKSKLFLMSLGIKILRLKKKNNEPTTITIQID